MSYSGYVQKLCKNGHLSSHDTYEYKEENCYCGQPYVWSNNVDTTNGSYCYECGSKGCKWCNNGRIDGYIELEVEEDAKFEKCECCGNNKQVAPVKYKIPKKEEKLQ